MKNLIVFFALISVPFGAYSIDFKIGILRNVQVKKFAFKVSEGEIAFARKLEVFLLIVKIDFYNSCKMG